MSCSIYTKRKKGKTKREMGRCQCFCTVEEGLVVAVARSEVFFPVEAGARRPAISPLPLPLIVRRKGCEKTITGPVQESTCGIQKGKGREKGDRKNRQREKEEGPV